MTHDSKPNGTGDVDDAFAGLDVLHGTQAQMFERLVIERAPITLGRGVRVVIPTRQGHIGVIQVAPGLVDQRSDEIERNLARAVELG